MTLLLRTLTLCFLCATFCLLPAQEQPAANPFSTSPDLAGSVAGPNATNAGENAKPLRPWSHLNFRNKPENFQFAIVADRTGGLRPGVFPKALKRINLLEPEFVITVGDLIVGNRKSTDEKKLHAMWDEMDGFIDQLDMPFFYLAGNHDNGSPLLSKVWKERFGVERYHFVYQNVLFLCMNAQDTQQFTAVIGDAQQAWAKKVLADHPEVRWTFVFIHQPVWMYEDGVEIAEAGRTLPARSTGWKPVEAALKGRPHTVFAGHIHQYIRYKKEAANTSYYTLATTGGGNKLRGANFGEFDHAMWVTMTDEGPKIANLLIDGILPADVNTEEAELFRGLVDLQAKITSDEPLSITAELAFSNRFASTLSGHYDWELEQFSGWRATPLFREIVIEPGETLRQTFELVKRGDPAAVNPRPVFHLELQDEEGIRYTARQELPVDYTAWYKKHNLKPPKLSPKEVNQRKKTAEKAAKSKAVEEAKTRRQDR